MDTDRSSALYARHATALVADALAYRPAVFLMGARQVGKSTLAEQVAADAGIADSVTLDDEITRSTAAADPAGFLADFAGAVLIDEVQRVPRLLLAIKRDIDRSRRPGRFLLTGSANILTVPKVLDALTGRLGLVTLWPLAQSEIEGTHRNLVDVLLKHGAKWVRGAPVGRAAFVPRVVAGGFPAAHGATARQRHRFFADYVTSTLHRDLREIADIRKVHVLPRLLKVLAARVGGIHVVQSLASALALNHDTVLTYTGLLETLFLVRAVPAWRPGIGNREIHAPKVYFVDSGLLASLLGADERRVAADDQFTGRLFENFVAMEIAKHVDWAETIVTQYHYRSGNDEVDVILEANSGEVVAIEAKASATLGRRDWRALAKLRDAVGDRFRAGVIVYTGEQTIPLGDRLRAMPVSGLWSGG
ncbi:MAG TPA: ATP-binding protein [Conexibacter sp.]|jgi:predicted AAA+ superfamily ATPase|nr:ATP-binding protein [Conexibacter sp.]